MSGKFRKAKGERLGEMDKTETHRREVQEGYGYSGTSRACRTTSTY